MSDEEALLAAIRDDPDEDTPRLAYADWLDEHGQRDRAEFIRVQVGAAGLRWNDPRWEGLAGRAKQLLEGHWEEWVGPFAWLAPGGRAEIHLDEPTVDGWGGGVQLSWTDPMPSDMGDPAPPYERSVDFHRGFPRKVWLEPGYLPGVPVPTGTIGPRPVVSVTWAPHAGDHGWPARIWPDISRALRAGWFSGWAFRTVNYEFGWLPPLAADESACRGVVGLYLEGGHAAADADLIPLFRTMPNLTSLDLTYGGWSPAAVRALGSAGLAARLRHLECFNNQAPDGEPFSAADVLRAMADAADWPQLVGLSLGSPDGAGAGVLGLIRPGMFPALRLMRFWGRGGTAEFFAGLLARPHFAEVERVEYWGRVWGRDASLERLAEGSGGRFVYR